MTKEKNNKQIDKKNNQNRMYVLSVSWSVQLLHKFLTFIWYKQTIDRSENVLNWYN